MLLEHLRFYRWAFLRFLDFCTEVRLAYHRAFEDPPTVPPVPLKDPWRFN